MPERKLIKRVASMANLAKDAGLEKPELKPKKNGRPSKDAAKPAEQSHPIVESIEEKTSIELAKNDTVKALYKLRYGARGKAYLIYQVAAFTLFGGFTPGRKGMDTEQLSKLFTNKSHIDKMVNSNWMEFTKDGHVRLTKGGYDFAKSQIDGVKQYGMLVDCIVKAMQTGIWEGKSIIFPSSSTSFVKI